MRWVFSMSTKVKSPDNLPNKPGVYIMRDSTDTIIYIGKAKNLVKRVKSYFRKNLTGLKLKF